MELPALKTFVLVFIMATAVFFAGAAFVFGWTSGVDGIIFSPLLAIFGWFLWFPIYGLILGAWLLFNPRKRSLVYRAAFVTGCSLLGFVLSLLLSGRNPSSSPDLVEALRLACIISGGLAACMVVVIKTSLMNHTT